MSFDYEVFALGQCVLDRLGVIPRDPGWDNKQEIAELTEQCGGPAATATVALARWGRKAAFAGVVGDDAAGRAIAADLEKEGVMPLLLERAASESQFAFVAIEQGTGRRKIYWRRATGAAPGADELDWPRARVFLTDGLYRAPSIAAAARADLVVVDAGTLRDGTEAMIPHADVFVASQSFAEAFASDGQPTTALRRLRELGVAVAGVTLGEHGYLASFGETWLERPAHAVDAIDTTGCGDLFHAALVEGALASWPWERTFDFAAWVGAQGATAVGGRAGIPDRADYPGGQR